MLYTHDAFKTSEGHKKANLYSRKFGLSATTIPQIKQVATDGRVGE